MIQLIELLNEFTSRNPNTRTLGQRFLDFINTDPAPFDRESPIGHITGSAWLVNPSKSKVLLTHHRKLDRWLQLGGHSDGDPDTLRVAMREATEESGISGITPLSGKIFDLDIHPIPASSSMPEHLHYDIRFALLAPHEKFVISEESSDLAWVPVAQLGEYSSERSLLRMGELWLTGGG